MRSSLAADQPATRNAGAQAFPTLLDLAVSDDARPNFLLCMGLFSQFLSPGSAMHRFRSRGRQCFALPSRPASSAITRSTSA